MKNEANNMNESEVIDIAKFDPSQIEINSLIDSIQVLGIEFGVKLMTAILIFVLGRWAVNLVVSGVRSALTKIEMEDTLEKFLCNILNAVLMVVILIASIGALGVQTTSLLAILGAAGLAIGLALQGSLSNFASGVLIVAFQPYKVGDFIVGGGESGTVEEVQIFTTVLRTPDNKKIIVPNSQIMDGTITNFSAHKTRRVDLVISCGYGDDLDKVYRVLNDIIEKHPLILKNPSTSIDLNTLADSSVNFNVRPWCNSGDYWAVYNQITEQVKRRFDQEGISIPFPQRDLHIYNHSPEP
jgi:small conductance mechanosensitive channel